MKKLLVAGIAAAAFCGAPAIAADMPVKAPPAAPMFNWTGWYVGGHAGYGWGRDNVLVSPEPQPAFGLVPFTTHNDPKGFIGGGQIGVNRQLGALVFGVEADFSGTDITGNVIDPTPVLLGGPGSFQQVHEKMNWFGTLRGRVGFAPSDNLLIYATGGLAVGHHTYSSLTFFPGTQYTGVGNATNSGWTIGGGAEWALPGNWSAKLEYLHYDLADHTITALPSPIGGIFHVDNKFDNTGNIARVGLNYKFSSH
jgi:outer membrane immunogenic protein